MSASEASNVGISKDEEWNMRDFKAFAWDIQNPVPRRIWVCDKFTAICLNLSQFIANFFFDNIIFALFFVSQDWFFGLNPRAPFYFWLKTITDQNWREAISLALSPQKNNFSGFFQARDTPTQI